MSFSRKMKDMIIKIASAVPVPAKLELAVDSQKYPYLSAGVEHDSLVFIMDSKDRCLLPSMLNCKAVWAKEEMDFLLKYLQSVGHMRGGVFLDCGANIGTTSIYMKKMLGKVFDVYAFEPVRENYNLLRVNCIMNDCEDIVVENIGFSDKEAEMEMTVDFKNWGRCHVAGINIYGAVEETAIGHTKARFMKLDDYIDRSAMDRSRLKCIWVDTEGHEPAVIAGGLHTLKETDACLYMEFSPRLYGSVDTDGLIENLSECFAYFICYEQYKAGRTDKRTISELVYLADEMNGRQCNLLLFK